MGRTRVAVSGIASAESCNLITGTGIFLFWRGNPQFSLLRSPEPKLVEMHFRGCPTKTKGQTSCYLNQPLRTLTSSGAAVNSAVGACVGHDFLAKTCVLYYHNCYFQEKVALGYLATLQCRCPLKAECVFVQPQSV